MTRINTNLSSLLAVHDLRASNQQLSKALERLSTGLKINSGADGPADLIISELLRAEKTSISQAIDNSSRATNVISTAEAALNEVNSILISIRDLAVASANTASLTDEELNANQLQIDSAVESISRIANATTFGGTHLLNGNFDYTVSGVNGSVLPNVSLHAVQFGTNSNLPVAVKVTDSATTAGLKVTLSQGGSAINSAVTLMIAGTKGADVFSFGTSAAGSAIAFGINARKDATGVSAVYSAGTSATSGALYIVSSGYGSDAFVSVEALQGSLTTVDMDGGAATTRAVGQDAVATINGYAALADGNVLTLNAGLMNLTMTLAAGFASNTSFTITGGGALFQLGQDVVSTQQQNIGIQSTHAAKLGDGSVGFLSDIVTGGMYSLLSGNAQQAADIIDAAILDVTTLRGRLGSFQLNTLETNINSLEVALENVTASESTIRDADFAVETANLTRAQILVAAGTSVLASANSTPQSVLALLK